MGFFLSSDEKAVVKDYRRQVNRQAAVTAIAEAEAYIKQVEAEARESQRRYWRQWWTATVVAVLVLVIFTVLLVLGAQYGVVVTVR